MKKQSTSSDVAKVQLELARKAGKLHFANLWNEETYQAANGTMIVLLPNQSIVVCENEPPKGESFPRSQVLEYDDYSSGEVANVISQVVDGMFF